MKQLTVKLMFAQFLLWSNLGLLWAQQDLNAGQVPADNTRVNKRDRNQTESTADQQQENASDRELVRQIRRALVRDKFLSSEAHNVKVIAQNGTVTLKGSVESEQEKLAVEAKARQIAGVDKVTSEIQVVLK
jgi:hyperosmotically inducible periplasmic protein